MFDVFEFFDNEIGFTVWFDTTDNFLFLMGIRNISVVPLLMVSILDFNGFVFIRVTGVQIVRSELNLHSVGSHWP